MSEGRQAEIARGPSLDPFRGVSRVERALLPFLRESTLWPVLGAVVAHAIALVAPILVIVWRDPDPGWPMIGLGVLATLSLLACGVEVRDRRRPGPIAALIGVTWALCGAGAWGGVQAGLF